ncbi:MAG: glycosyltransferase, partial [Oscillospiraceae bacterium]
MKNKMVVLIPALSPDDKMLSLIKDIDFADIVIVNDGSDNHFNFIFDNAKELGATILKHNKNMGKGAALKTGFEYIIKHYPKDTYICCADCDGQHKSADILKCLNACKENKNCLILGSRCFSKKDIPLRSRLGNKLTRSIFNMLCGIKVADTQTGLRALSTSTAKLFLNVKGDRFEYEMNMLIETKPLSINIIEVPIQTLYIEENKSSHFNPFLDSLRIYKVLMKFIVSSIISFLIDISLFFLVANFFPFSKAENIIYATLISRIISSFANYFINRKKVFYSKNKSSILKYYILAAIQLIISGISVSLLAHFTP